LTARLETKIEAEVKTNNEKYSHVPDTYPSSQVRGHSRRNNSQDGHPSEKNGSQCECLAKK
jgi:hypothetical protein